MEFNPRHADFQKAHKTLISYKSITNGMPVATIPTVKHSESCFNNAKLHKLIFSFIVSNPSFNRYIIPVITIQISIIYNALYNYDFLKAHYRRNLIEI